jgi:hypothetical protein
VCYLGHERSYAGCDRGTAAEAAGTPEPFFAPGPSRRGVLAPGIPTEVLNEALKWRLYEALNPDARRDALEEKLDKTPGETMGDALASARADGQQDFLAEGILELLELQSRLTFVAEYFEHRWTTFFRHFHAPVFEMDDVHLQRLDLKIPVVAAMWTSQRHERTPLESTQSPIPARCLARRTKPDSM